MQVQYFVNSWLTKYYDLTKVSLLNKVSQLGEKLKEGKSYTKADLRLIIFEKEYNDYLVSSYDYSTIEDISEFGKERCTGDRRQPYIFNEDLEYIVSVMDKSIVDKVEKILWVSGNRSLMILKNGNYVLTQPKYFTDDFPVPLENFITSNRAFLVNYRMSPLTYYLYRKETVLNDGPRSYSIKYPDYFIMDDIVLLKMRLENVFVRRILTKKAFDYLEKIDKVFWSHIKLNQGGKNYLFYKTDDNIYTLIKFKSRVENDKIAIKWPQVYLATTYKDIIEKCLTYEEYKLYNQR
jgi:hypothetical protein